MTDIKIEKTAGGFKAVYEDDTYYSTNGMHWADMTGCVLMDDGDLIAAFIVQFIDPLSEKSKPVPKIYAGDPNTWEPGIGGVFREVDNTRPFVVLVDYVGDFITLIYAPNPEDRSIVSYHKPKEKYHRIADNINDIFREDILGMEAI